MYSLIFFCVGDTTDGSQEVSSCADIEEDDDDDEDDHDDHDDDFFYQQDQGVLVAS